MPFKPRLVGNGHGFWRDLDCPFPPQQGERPRHGFDRKAEIIGEIDARHRQHERDRQRRAREHPVAPSEQEGGDALDRGLAAKQQHLLLRQSQFVPGGIEQAPFECGEMAEHRGQFRPVEPAEPYLLQRLRRDGIGLLRGQPQEIAWSHEAGDLSPAVRQRLEQFHHALVDIEEMPRRLAFLDENLARSDALLTGDTGEKMHILVRQHIAEADTPRIAGGADFRRDASGNIDDASADNGMIGHGGLSLCRAQLAALSPKAAQAIPAFAAQTGMKCSACHIGFPQLTPFGRQFKLQGYILGGTFPTWKNFALMSQIGVTQMHDKVPGGLAPGFKSNDAWAAQQTSLFFGGALDAKLGLGAFAQVTYDGVAHQWHWDNLDIRLAHPGKLFGKPLFYGLTFNNAPTVTDLWNSPPSWGYPYIPSSLAVGPIAQQQIPMLAQGVYGFGAYGALNITSLDMIYAEADLYKSLPNRLSYALGVGPAAQIDGVIPYLRLALQRTWGNSAWEIGTYALLDRPYPQGMINGPTDQFLDVAADSQFQYITGKQAFSVQANIIHESQDWRASYPLGLAGNRADTLDTLTLTVSELFLQKYGVTESFRTIYGNADPVLYTAGPVGGSANGKPNTDSWTTELDYYPFNNGGPNWLPWLNAKIFFENTMYSKFNGLARKYDGAGRSAGANDTVFTGIWLAF